MELNITKIANVILYMLENKVSHLNDKKLSILLFLMDYKHMEIYENKIFGEIYIKDNRSPEPQVLAELFDIIANSEDLEEDDERLYLIQEFLDHLDIDVVTKANYIELKFVKMEDDFDESLFTKEELKTINKAIERYKNETPRKMANVCFTIDKVRETKNGEIII
ncbi:MAG: DUF4065 domain-containing protein [Campylobacteraceae bacterium]|nr:DUF4065 domain-containing protein [Campylobacteraceae bacterium]MBT3881793.1 DUF4065 domain-containing protein [Campylobacteraceae bacterium]MBT4030560.1 DUF4065 domain-containing protein [Campylobacteraceae bacterium]MBT4179848.1 DUF4065 domain-containing protein [Campylobacteraceae bacterium]MBT4572441.1 DUF4065 domain-containing protein [Campylobacteraceae bacterium]